MPKAEGKKGGQFYTPGSVVRVLVEALSPHKGRIYDPCCGSGGMFVQSEKFVESRLHPRQANHHALEHARMPRPCARMTQEARKGSRSQLGRVKGSGANHGRPNPAILALGEPV